MFQIIFNLAACLAMMSLAWLAARGQMEVMVVPFGLLAGVFAVLAVIQIRVIRWNRRFAKGLCTYCGYDLRHSENECPECGAQPMNGMKRDLERWIDLEAEAVERHRTEKF